MSNNIVVDSGVDLIAGGKMSLPSGATFTTVSGNPVAGAFDLPGFIAQSYSTSADIATIASNLKTAFSFVFGLSPSVLFGPAPTDTAAGNQLLDLTPNTLTTSIPTFVPPTPFVFDYAIAGAAPREQLVAGTVPFDFKVAYPPAVPGPIVQEDLKDAGLYTHDPSLDEIIGAVDTMAVYDDMPDRPRPRAADYKVVVNRLDSRRLDAFLNEYKQVFGQDPEARRTEIALDVQRAWDAYVSQNGDQPVNGAGFAQYCATTPSAANASADLQQLHALRVQLASLGLSYKEAQVAFQYNVLTGLSAIGMRKAISRGPPGARRANIDGRFTQGPATPPIFARPADFSRQESRLDHACRNLSPREIQIDRAAYKPKKPAPAGQNARLPGERTCETGLC